jgi:hypothetical protein
MSFPLAMGEASLGKQFYSPKLADCPDELALDPKLMESVYLAHCREIPPSAGRSLDCNRELTDLLLIYLC